MLSPDQSFLPLSDPGRHKESAIPAEERKSPGRKGSRPKQPSVQPLPAKAGAPVAETKNSTNLVSPNPITDGDSGRDPWPANRFVEKGCSFDYQGQRLVGVIISQRYVGANPRGGSPDWMVTIRGATGKTVEVSFLDSYCRLRE